MDFQSRLLYLILALPAFVLAFTLHEFAHAYTAHRLGDDTAKKAGKMSLDPLKMLDPIGSGRAAVHDFNGLAAHRLGFGAGHARQF